MEAGAFSTAKNCRPVLLKNGSKDDSSIRDAIRIPYHDDFLWLYTGVNGFLYLYSDAKLPAATDDRIIIAIKDYCPVLVELDQDKTVLSLLCDESTEILDIARKEMHDQQSVVVFWYNTSGVLMVSVRSPEGSTLTMTAEEYRDNHSLFYAALKEMLVAGRADFVRQPAPGTVIVRPGGEPIRIPLQKPEKEPDNQEPEDGGTDKNNQQGGSFPFPADSTSVFFSGGSGNVVGSQALSGTFFGGGSQQGAASAPAQAPQHQLGGGAVATLNSKMVPLLADKAGNNNSVFSPMSLAIPLALLGTGANGSTRNEFQELMNSQPSPQSMENRLESLVQASKVMSNSDVVTVGNLVVTRPDIAVKQEYQLVITRMFQWLTRPRHFEFSWKAEPNLSSDQFRNWLNKAVSDLTAGKIPNLLTQNLSSDTVMVLVNTILFKAKWKKKLSLEAGFVFKGVDNPCHGKTTPAVRYKNALHAFVHSDLGREWQGVWCPFSDENFGLLLTMPRSWHYQNALKDDVDVFAKSMTAIHQGGHHFVTAIFPKMKVESGWNLAGMLRQQGMIPSAFTRLADFSRLFEVSGVHISSVIQKAIFELDEVGVQAAAATLVSTGLFSGMIPNPEVRFDHPFRATIVHRPSNLILFETTINKTPDQPNMTW
ncbi:serpin family protein [Endozoicomonas gorgoniicola]|uniref:Serpin family protein n=1 Tax=Endozoicomonas gorgoniicola TaxID=1234144 RepID=A0ABT3MPA5_9GAMM|nr:serpin family protein [Endozoicomonas gorgoniicola]MCW7551202.1 serpin family protein [Endozoicomonas gorgoniicola]